MEPSVSNDWNQPLSTYLMGKSNFDPEKLKLGAILLFDKPFEWSSFRLVKKVRHYSKAKKVGHAGTLDPLATGLLIICTGKCTKMIEQIQNLEKVYTGRFNFGKTTPSFDLETEFDAEYPVDHITPEMIESTVISMTGEIDQTPPVFSAIKVNGVRAYEFARSGEALELKSRKINIYDFKVGSNMPSPEFEVKCSKGTYIRTLASDFGKALGSGCYLTELSRTAIGEFNLKDAFKIEEFQELCGF